MVWGLVRPICRLRWPSPFLNVTLFSPSVEYRKWPGKRDVLELPKRLTTTSPPPFIHPSARLSFIPTFVRSCTFKSRGRRRIKARRRRGEKTTYATLREAEAESDTKGIEIEGESERRRRLRKAKKLEYDFASRERDRRRP